MKKFYKAAYPGRRAAEAVVVAGADQRYMKLRGEYADKWKAA